MNTDIVPASDPCPDSLLCDDPRVRMFPTPRKLTVHDGYQLDALAQAVGVPYDASVSAIVIAARALLAPTIVESPAAPVMLSGSSGAAHLLPAGIPRLDEALESVAVADAMTVTRSPAPSVHAIRAARERCRDLSTPSSYDAAKRILARLVGWPETVEGPTFHAFGAGARLVSDTLSAGFVDRTPPQFAEVPLHTSATRRDYLVPGLVSVEGLPGKLAACLVAVGMSA